MLTKVDLLMPICVVLDPVNGIGRVSVFLFINDVFKLLSPADVMSHSFTQSCKTYQVRLTVVHTLQSGCSWMFDSYIFFMWNLMLHLRSDEIKQLQDKDLSTADNLKQPFDSAHIDLPVGGCLGLVFCVCICMVSLCSKSWLSRWSLSSCLMLCCVSWFRRCRRSCINSLVMGLTPLGHP